MLVKGTGKSLSSRGCGLSLEEMEFVGGEQLTWGHLLVKASPTKDEKGNDRNGLAFQRTTQ